jgi:hypothetical protein
LGAISATEHAVLAHGDDLEDAVEQARFAGPETPLIMKVPLADRAWIP